MERRKLTNKKPKYNKDGGPNDKHKSGEISIKQNNNENKKRKQDLNKIKPKNKSYDFDEIKEF